MTHRLTIVVILAALVLLDVASADSRDRRVGRRPFMASHVHRHHTDAPSILPIVSFPAATFISSVSASDSDAGTILLLRGGGGDNIQTITSLSQIQSTLDASLKDNRLVVLDFASNNCPPCEMIAPVYEELSGMEEFDDVAFCKVNVSDHPEVAERYGVDGWPTFLLFKGGEVVDSVVGGQAAKEGLYFLVAKHA